MQGEGVFLLNLEFKYAGDHLKFASVAPNRVALKRTVPSQTKDCLHGRIVMCKKKNKIK
jgi:hypothetical protein